MFPKVVFICFKLCLLIVICTSTPQKRNPKRPYKDYEDPFQISDVRTSDEQKDFNLSGFKLKVSGQDSEILRPKMARDSNKVSTENDSGDESGEQLSDMEDEEVKSGNNEENVPVVSENLEDTDKINDDEKKIDPVPAEELSDQTDSENNKTIDDEVTDADNKNNNDIQNTSERNDVVPPSPSDDKEETAHNNCKLWGGDRIGVKFDTKKLSSLASFKLNSDEIKKFKIWPKATIPYLIDDFSYGKVLRDKIRDYLDHAGLLSGLNFQELPNPPDSDDERWVFIVNRRGQLDCQDYTSKSFTNSGVQKVVIGYDCLNNNGHIASVVLALAGVPPQHNAPDRDRFINVSMESILPEKQHLFKRLGDGDWLFHDLGYDYNSAGHYASHKYTADGSSTITVPDKTVQSVQEQDTFSYTDLQKLRMLYNNILQNSPNRNIKLNTCNALFPNSNSGYVKLSNTHNTVPVRPKPKKYLAAIAKDSKSALKYQTMNGEVLCSDVDR